MAKKQTSKFPSERDPKFSGLRLVSEILTYRLAELKRNQQEHSNTSNVKDYDYQESQQTI